MSAPVWVEAIKHRKTDAEEWIEIRCGGKRFGSDGSALPLCSFHALSSRLRSLFVPLLQQRRRGKRGDERGNFSPAARNDPPMNLESLFSSGRPSQSRKPKRAAPSPDGSSRWHPRWQPCRVRLCGSVMRKTTVETRVRPQTINGAICKSHLFNRESVGIKDQEVEAPKILLQPHFPIFFFKQLHNAVWFHVAFHERLCLMLLMARVRHSREHTFQPNMWPFRSQN